jgi:putative acetyltransferase
MTSSVLIRPDLPGEAAAVRSIYQAAFGRPAEAILAESLRAGGHSRISLLALVDQQPAGHILFSDLPIVTTSGPPVHALFLALLGVLPNAQQDGLATRLVVRGLLSAHLLGYHSVFVRGDPAFYQRFGFDGNLAAGVLSSFRPPSFMALELVPGVLAGFTGSTQFPPPFCAP